MRIGRSFGFNFRLLSKEVLTTGLGIFSLALIFTVGYMAVSQRQVSAVVPPNSCFVFDEATGTIMDYGDGPLGGVTGMRTIGTCPASVDIPSQINNTDVKIIADHAFHGKGPTAVNLPATLVEIGDQSFLSNQISGSIVIPDSVVTIKHAAFGINSITSVVLGSSVQFIGD